MFISVAIFLALTLASCTSLVASISMTGVWKATAPDGVIVTLDIVESDGMISGTISDDTAHSMEISVTGTRAGDTVSLRHLNDVQDVLLAIDGIVNGSRFVAVLSTPNAPPEQEDLTVTFHRQ